MPNLILTLQHHLNPLHIYCRLLDMGLSKRLSGIVCRCYEILIYKWLRWLIRLPNVFFRFKLQK
jgi:hypothetical protein